MSQIKSSEKRLLIGLGVAVFILANVFGGIMVTGAMTTIASEKKKLTGRLDALEKAKAQSAEADEKGAWIAANLRPYENEAVREIYLNDQINGDLTAGLDVEITKNAPMPTIEGLYFYKSRYRATIKGPWQDVKQFLWRLQKPEEFRFVPRLSMVPKKSELDDAVQLAEVTVELEKWWPKPEDLMGIEGTPEENVEQPATPPVESTTSPATPPSGENPAPAPGTDSTKPSEPPPASDSPPPVPEAPPAAAPETSTEPPKPNQ